MINGIIGPVDLDISYVDYSEIIKINGLNGIQKLISNDNEEPIEVIDSSDILNIGNIVLVSGIGKSASDGTGRNTKEFNSPAMKIIAISNNTYLYACSQNINAE